MPALQVPPCPDNWEHCSFCGAGPEDNCKYPDSNNGRRMNDRHPNSIICEYTDVPSRQWCGSGLCLQGGCIGGGDLRKVSAPSYGNREGPRVSTELPPRKPLKPVPHYITQDDAERKATPMARGLLDYFPAALASVAAHSAIANMKHNPGDDVHWARGKSMDHADCILRHLIERGSVEQLSLPGIDTPLQLRASAALAWRALALLQEELEAEGFTPGRAARFALKE